MHETGIGAKYGIIQTGLKVKCHAQLNKQ